MTKTIAINAGSSSLKWQLYQMPEEKVLAKGLIERIGLKDSVSTVKFDGRSEEQVLDIENHTLAVKILLDDLIRFNIIKTYDEITQAKFTIFANKSFWSKTKQTSPNELFQQGDEEKYFNEIDIMSKSALEDICTSSSEV